MRIVAVFDVDPDICKEVSGCEELGDAIRSEMGWTRDSGIFLRDWCFEDTDKLDELAFLAGVRKSLAENGHDPSDAEVLLKKYRMAVKESGTWMMPAEAAGALCDLLSDGLAPKALLRKSGKKYLGALEAQAEDGVFNAILSAQEEGENVL